MPEVNGVIKLGLAVAGGLLIVKFLPALVVIGIIASIYYINKDESSKEETNEECQYGKQEK